MESRIATADSGLQSDDAAPPTSRLLPVIDRIAVALSALACAALAFLALNEPLVSDDFSGAIILRQHPGLWDVVSSGYTSWSGRFSASAFSWLAMQVRPAYGIVIWSGLILLMVMTFALARGRLPCARRADLYVMGLLLSACWLGMPAMEETIFWASGSFVYLWPAVATLVFLYQYRRWDAKSAPRSPGALQATAAVVAMVLLGVWVGASQEQMLVASVLFLAVHATRAVRAGRLWSMPVHLYAGAFSLVLAGAASLMAPGNSVRLAQVPDEGLWLTLIAAAKYLVHVFVEWLPPYAPWLLCLALLAVPVALAGRHGDERPARSSASVGDWWLWTLLGLATMSPFLVRPYFGAERTVMFCAVFLTVAVISLGNDGEQERVLNRLPALVTSAVLGLLLLAVSCDIGLSGWQARELRLGQEKRSAAIEAQKRDGIRDVAVVRLTDDEPRRGVIWSDGSADRDFWLNTIMADYYEVDSIVVTDLQ
ncbi:MAG: hypothetical protein JXA36_02750 [Coriobacteriia bacterium]|nr:hypothetical protein [Coriobacteriia bacterium]